MRTTVKAEVTLYRDDLHGTVMMQVQASDGGACCVVETIGDRQVGAAFLHWAEEQLNIAGCPKFPYLMPCVVNRCGTSRHREYEFYFGARRFNGMAKLDQFLTRDCAPFPAHWDQGQGGFVRCRIIEPDCAGGVVLIELPDDQRVYVDYARLRKT